MKVEKLTVADLEVKQFYEKQDKDKSDTYVIIPFFTFYNQGKSYHIGLRWSMFRRSSLSLDLHSLDPVLLFKLAFKAYLLQRKGWSGNENDSPSTWQLNGDHRFIFLKKRNIVFRVKDTIRVGGSTALKTYHTFYTAYTSLTAHTV